MHKKVFDNNKASLKEKRKSHNFTVSIDIFLCWNKILTLVFKLAIKLFTGRSTKKFLIVILW